MDNLNNFRIEFTLNEEDDEKGNLIKKLADLSAIVNEINNLPLNKNEIDKYKISIANIYQLGILYDLENAKNYAIKLKKEIERNLIIRKKNMVFIPVILGYLFIGIICGLSIRFNINIPGEKAMLYGSLGGIVAAIFQNNKLIIDYYVKNEFLYLEAFKIILLSNVLALIGQVFINSGILLENILTNKNNININYLILILCGYSQTFIPNMLKTLENENSKE